MNHDQPPTTIAALRTRGPFKLHEVDSALARGSRSRAGGRPLAVRGIGAYRDADSAEPFSLPACVTALRREVGDLPLTAVVEAPVDACSQAFIGELRPLLGARDSVWIVVPEGADLSVAASLQGQVLDLQQETDRRIHANMHSDLLFLPDAGPAPEERVAFWQRRTRVLFVDWFGETSHELADAAVAASIVTFTWRKGELAAWER